MTLTKRFEVVWNVLRTMEKKCCPTTSATFSIIIQSCIEASLVNIGWKAFKESRDFGVKLDAHTHTVLMQSLLDSGMVGKARKVFASMLNCGLEVNTNIWSILIYGLCKNKKMDGLMRYLQQLHASGSMLDAELYNAVIVGLCEQKHPEPELAFSLLNLMQEHGCKPLTCSYNAIIQVYCSRDMFAEADSLISTMQKAGCKPNQMTYNVLLEYALEKGEPEVAASIFKRMHGAGMVDSYSYRIYAKRLGVESELIAFWETLSSKDGTCDVEVCNAILQHYCDLGELSKASKYLNEDFVWLSAPNDYSYTLMIDAFCKARDADAARSLLSSMDERGCKPSGRNYEPIVAALCEDSKELEAFQLFQEMIGKGIESSSSICQTLLKSLSSAGLVDLAVEMSHHIAERQHVIKDRHVALAFVKCLSKSNQLQEANVHIRKLMKQGCLPRKSTSFRTALAYMMLGEFEEVEKYLNRQLPNAISYGAMLRTACRKKQFSKVTAILSEMKVQGCDPYSLIMGLSKLRDRSMDCVELYEEMLERRLVSSGKLHELLMQKFCRAKQDDAILKLGKLMIAKGLTVKSDTVPYLESTKSPELKKLYIELNDNSLLVERFAAGNEEEVDLGEEDSE